MATEANQNEANENGADGATPPPKGKKVVLMLLGIGLVTGGASGAVIGGPMLAKRRASGAAITEAAAADRGEHGKGGKDGKDGGTVVMVDNLVLNPAGSGGLRFLMVSAAFELNHEKAADDMRSRDAEIRDALLRVLGSRTVEQLVDLNGRQSIKNELTAVVDSVLKDPTAVRRLYFPQFVIQ
jgi:flagellar protein FliL